MAVEQKTFVARDLSWFEQQFNHKVIIVLPRSHKSGEWFFEIKEAMQARQSRWGLYRDEWLGHVCSDNVLEYHHWYFMRLEQVAWFRLTMEH